MKKSKKIKFNENLSPEELSQLIGQGRNENCSMGCKCTYYNGPSASSNVNWVEIPGGCSCECVGGDDDCDGGC